VVAEALVQRYNDKSFAASNVDDVSDLVVGGCVLVGLHGDDGFAFVEFGAHDAHNGAWRVLVGEIAGVNVPAHHTVVAGRRGGEGFVDLVVGRHVTAWRSDVTRTNTNNGVDGVVGTDHVSVQRNLVLVQHGGAAVTVGTNDVAFTGHALQQSFVGSSFELRSSHEEIAFHALVVQNGQQRRSRGPWTTNKREGHKRAVLAGFEVQNRDRSARDALPDAIEAILRCAGFTAEGGNLSEADGRKQTQK